jgi:hypothetical protein
VYGEAGVNRKKAVLSGFLLLWVSGIPGALAQEENIEFEDDMQILTKFSENLTIDQVSLKSFRCREKLVITESNATGQEMYKREYLNLYKVERQFNRQVATRTTFQETRDWQKAQDRKGPEAVKDFPVLENPFTGSLNQMFDLENRFANDFKKERQERIDGKECQVLRFETVSQLSGQKIQVLGQWLPLRQQGHAWIRVEDNRLLRIAAKQLKLPKGCRSYEYQIDYLSQPLFGKRPYLPRHTRLKVELKDKRFVVEQDYADFEDLP